MRYYYEEVIVKEGKKWDFASTFTSPHNQEIAGNILKYVHEQPEASIKSWQTKDIKAKIERFLRSKKDRTKVNQDPVTASARLQASRKSSKRQLVRSVNVKQSSQLLIYII